MRALLLTIAGTRSFGSPRRPSGGRIPTLLAAASLGLFTGCASSGPRYSGFADVTYPYAEARSLWSARSRAWIHVAEQAPDPGARSTSTATAAASSSATPLVLIHPWATNMLVWQSVAPELARDRRVLLVDLPGHGKSSKSLGRYPVRRLAAAVLDALDAAGIPHAIAIGNSLGGATALELALIAPDRVRAVVALGAPGGSAVPEPLAKLALRGSQPRALATLSDPALRASWWVVTPNMPPLTERLLADARALAVTPEWRHWARATSAALAEVIRYRPEVERIRAPALVVQGTRDLVVPESHGRTLAERIPDAKLALLEGCGHMPEVECPEALLQVLRPFLAGR